MKTKLRITRRWVVMGALLAIPLGAFVLQPFFFPWTEFNCRHQEVDINSGRLRYSRYLFYFKISERTEDSALSRALSLGIKSANGSKPQWHKVNTFSPGYRHSPHYIFHSAIHQIRMLGPWLESDSVSADIRTKIAEDVVALWKFDGSDSLAGDYIYELPFGDDENLKARVLERIATLKNPEVRTNEGRVTQTVFFPNGHPIESREGYFEENGAFVPHGVRKGWSRHGELHNLDHFKDGILHGLRFSWDMNGRLQSISEFRDGEFAEYDSEGLNLHPAFVQATQLFESNKVDGHTRDALHGEFK